MAFYDRFVDRTIARLGYTKSAMGPVFAGESPLGSFGADYLGPDASEEQRERLAITSAWVYSDIRTIANEASAADVDVFEGKKEIEDHAFETLLEHPNPDMTSSWMRQYTLWWLLLRGEAYWMKAYDRSGELRELWPLPSSHIQPIPDKQRYISGYKYTPTNGQEAVVFPKEQIVFFRLPNPFDFHRGLSPLTAYRLAVETDVAAAEWNKKTFKDDMTLRMLISLPAETGPATYTQLKAQLIEELVERKRRYVIARAGDIKATQLSVAQKDLEFLAGRGFTREEIDRVFGIPAGFWAKEATKANSDAAKAVLIEQAVWPLLVLVAETLTTQILQVDFSKGLRCVFDDIRETDRGVLVQERRVYWQVKTVNEAREELGLEALEDEEIGGTLVPLAVKGNPTPNPSLGTPTGSGQAGGGARPGPAPDGTPEFAPELVSVEGAAADAQNEAQMRRQLKTWEGIARRRIRAGESAGYDFESEAIPGELKAVILEGLGKAGNEEEVKAAFAAGFWWNYP